MLHEHLCQIGVTKKKLDRPWLRRMLSQTDMAPIATKRVFNANTC